MLEPAAQLAMHAAPVTAAQHAAESALSRTPYRAFILPQLESAPADCAEAARSAACSSHAPVARLRHCPAFKSHSSNAVPLTAEPSSRSGPPPGGFPTNGPLAIFRRVAPLTAEKT